MMMLMAGVVDLASVLWPATEDFHEGLLFEGLDAVFQGFDGVFFEDGAAELEDDGAGVQVFGDLVDGAAGFLRAGVED